MAGGALFAEARDQYERAIKLDPHSGVAVAIGAFITESPITIGSNLSITQGDGAGDSILVLNTIIGVGIEASREAHWLTQDRLRREGLKGQPATSRHAHRPAEFLPSEPRLTNHRFVLPR